MGINASEQLGKALLRKRRSDIKTIIYFLGLLKSPFIPLLEKGEIKKEIIELLNAL